METTTVTLRWAVLLLVAHPEVQAKIQAEIDAVIGRDRCPNMANKVSMPYMSAVLMEVQRKANVISFNSPHRTLKDTTIGGERQFAFLDTSAIQ
jgi:cytochrome P450